MKLHSRDLEMLSDEDLMARIQKADHGAFCVLVNRHTKMFFSAAYRMYPDANEAEDIVQEAYLKLWSRPQIWDATKGAKFTTWFYRVVTNLAIDHARKKKYAKGSDTLDRIMDKSPRQDEAFEECQKQAMLEEAIGELPERQRVALNLCFYEGLSNKEAAQVMDLNVKALESLLMRAKKGLKDILSRKGALSDGTGEDNIVKKGQCSYGS